MHLHFSNVQLVLIFSANEPCKVQTAKNDLQSCEFKLLSEADNQVAESFF